MSYIFRSSWRASEATKFLFQMTVPWFTTNFEEVPLESKLQPGDILLFSIQDKYEIFPRLFRHAAVYCGDEEVIHFQNTDNHANGGQISKEGFHAMLNKRGECQIYRKKAGVDLDAFQKKVKEVINSTAQYSLMENNCIHFALYLLDLADFYSEAVKIKKNDGHGSDAPCSDPGRSCSIF